MNTILKKLSKLWVNSILISAGALAVLVFFGFQNLEKSAGSDKEQKIMQLVHTVLATTHLQPVEIDEAFAEMAFENFIESMDFGKRFLFADDIKKLGSYKKKLHKHYASGNTILFDEAFAIFQKRLAQAEGHCENALKQKFDFSVDEYFETDDEKITSPKNEKEMAERWGKYIKYRILTRIYDREEEQEKDTTGEKKTYEEILEEAIKQERDLHKDWFDNFKDMDRTEWFGVFVNAFTQNYDPHTQYYPPQRKEDFEIEMTGQFEGIGAQLVQRNNYVTIDKIITGSASDRQGELEVGDKILKVKQKTGEAVDVVGMSIRKVVKLIRGKKGTPITLTVRKADGTSKDITIIRDVVEMEATFAKSALIEEDGLKIGYIRLPLFYVDFYNNTNRSCVQDVKMEIEALKNLGAESIIFDLRNNGGGTLEGVVDIVGLFIEEGPVVQVKGTGFSARVLRDRDRKIHFDGDLVVLTNNFSASASEIMAAAIQDYGRGTIMGTQNTFGKGTVQNMMDLDRALGFGQGNLKPLGALKLTIQKYYRINGGTPQIKGVTPDIVFPDQYQFLDFGEKEQKNAMAYSEIEPADYKKWPKAKGFDQAKKNSEQRIAENANFQMAAEYSAWLRDRKDSTRVSLKLEDYRALQAENKAMAEKIRDINKADEKQLSVKEVFTANNKYESDSDKKDYKRWREAVAKDIQVAEATQFLVDLRSANP